MIKDRDKPRGGRRPLSSRQVDLEIVGGLDEEVSPPTVREREARARDRDARAR